MKNYGLFDGEYVASQWKDEELTPREVEILRLIADGCDNKEIADRSFISLSTVKTHTAHIFRKLNAKTRLNAVLNAREAGFLK
jgi:DNA-binding NarL/FixJ family response regulator